MISVADSVFTETSLKRSCETLLDIVVGIPSSVPAYRILSSCSKILVSCAHRWRSLCVVGNDKFIGNLIVKKTKHLHFPSLKRVTIPALGTVGNPNFLFSSRAPTLEHLQLGEHPEWQDFSPTITLRTLELTFRPYPRIMSSPSFPYLIPTQTLIALSLSGNIRKWDLRPNSIPFPHLSSLTLHINTTTRFWGAIVAPNIERFIYSPFSLEDAHSDLQFNFGSKFDRVRYLRFLNASPDPHCDIDPEQLFQAFPHVRHVELDSEPMLHFSVPRRPCGQFCADIWSDLASLTIHGLSISWRSPLPRLWEWLKERKKFNIHPLHVKVTGIERGNSTKVHEYFLGFCHTGKSICTLELDARLSISLPRYISLLAVICLRGW